MKQLLRVMILLLVCCGINLSALANFDLDPTDAPESSFENTPSGVAIALALKNRIENGTKTHFIQLYLRNTTNSDVDYYPHPALIRIEIYYLNDTGAEVPLRHYLYSTNISSNPGPYKIPAGHTLSCDIILKDSEWKIVQTHQIICTCHLFAQGSKLLKVVSSPKLLKEAP